MLNLKSEVVIVSVFVFVGLASQAFAVNSWYWTGGNKTENKPGLYPPTTGEKGLPGARYQAAYCTDPSGIFWLFGGYGYGKAGQSKGYLGDLWSFDPSNGTWTWVSGSPLANYAGVYPPQAGSIGFPRARASGSLFCDGNGDIWLFAGIQSSGPISDFWQYNSLTELWTLQAGNASTSQPGVFNGIGNVGYPGSRSQASYWTSGTTFYLFGGKSSTGYLNDFWTYQVGSIINGWQFLGGSTGINDGGSYPVQYGETGYPMSRGFANTWIDKNGTLWVDGGWANGNLFLDDLWWYSPFSGVWTFVNGFDVNEQPVYPSQTGVAGGQPGSRAVAVTWFGASQSAYILGGRDNKVFSDLWAYNSIKNSWTYVGGSEALDAPAVWPQAAGGIGSPASRYGAAAWTDSSNRFWLFGGQSGVDSSILNDMWTYKA